MTSLGVRLLTDLRQLFTRAGTDRMRTTDILTALCELEEAPWGDLDGKPLTARRMARELDRYGVEPTPYKHDGKTVKGYQATGPHSLTDAWDRYLPPRQPTVIGNSGNSGNCGNCGNCGNPAGHTVTQARPVTDGSVTTPPPVTDPSVTPHPSVTR